MPTVAFARALALATARAIRAEPRCSADSPLGDQLATISTTRGARCCCRRDSKASMRSAASGSMRASASVSRNAPDRASLGRPAIRRCSAKTCWLASGMESVC
jgi:hypothetical protein